MKSNPEPVGPAQASQRRKMALLGLLAVLIVASIAYQYSGGPIRSLSRSQQSSREPATKLKAGDALNTEDPEVEIAELKAGAGEYKPEKARNPFSFFTPPPPPPSPAVLAQQEKEAAPPPPPPPPVCGDGNCRGSEDYQSCPADCPPPPPPEISLKYIGYIEEKDGVVAFLTDGKEVYMGRLNDIIANKYKVVRISSDGVELGYLNLKQSRTIPFVGMPKS